ncbi:MAG: hypothetical protein ACRYG7_06385 [Janthinobacterium lividum]
MFRLLYIFPFMSHSILLNLNLDPSDGSACRLTYEAAEGWLRGTWSGYVDEDEAMRGAAAYLRRAALAPCPYLLNDNVALRGPWFDSLDWLARAWVPAAARLGLRYVAHVVQADRHADIIPERLPPGAPFELQVFHDLAQAQHWLRLCRNAPQAVLGMARRGGSAAA